MYKQKIKLLNEEKERMNEEYRKKKKEEDQKQYQLSKHQTIDVLPRPATTEDAEKPDRRASRRKKKSIKKRSQRSR